MFTVTLLTNPKSPALDRAMVESLRNAWGGGNAVWLDPGVAAEFPVAAYRPPTGQRSGKTCRPWASTWPSNPRPSARNAC